MVIYIDVLLALGGWVDFLLLLGVRRLSGGQARPWRLALGALVGALFGLWLLVPPMPVWLSLTVKLAGAAVMVLVSFRFQGWRMLARQIGQLFSLSAGLAGLCGALYYFAAPTGFYVMNGVVYYAVEPLWLVGLTVLCYGLLWGLEWLMRRRAPAGHLVRVRLRLGARRTECVCLYDSGNHLVEPFSGAPVLVVERAVAERLCAVPRSDAALPGEPGWRWIPYHTIGGEGLLPAFLPDALTLLTRHGACDAPGCYVAVCERLGRGEYQGLMGSHLGELCVNWGGKAKCFTDG